ncbi:MAG TPA: cytochrome c-type biogenesis protein CcmH [Anaerolineales bacterium]
MRKSILALAFSLLVILLFTGIAFAQQPQVTPSDDQVNAIAKQLYCPVCENTPLDVCPTTACARWRDLIRQQLAAGKTEQEIKTYFVEQYGARVLGAPPPRGINLLVYLVPVVAVVAGAYVLFRVYRSWKRPTPLPPSPPTDGATPPTQAATEDEYIHRLEEEVRKG